VNVLDENIPLDQFEILRAAGIHCRVIGRDLSHLSADDEHITVLLHRLKQPTFLTRDEDFFRRDLCHPNYALFFWDIRPAESDDFIRRVLRHPRFRTKAQRMGIVARAHHDGISFWQRNRGGLQLATWS
jgi:hypothetical protein